MKHGGVSGRKIFLQHPRSFITNVTTDTFNRKAAEKTRITKRLAEWEVHFLTGFVGATHWLGLVVVISSDVLEQVVGERRRNTAYREAASTIVLVDQDLKQVAPVLRKKLIEVLVGGVKSKPGQKLKSFAQALPELVVKDDKTTGRIAGAIAAKFIVNSKNKNLVWFFIFETIAAQVAIKSAVKVPPALGQVFAQSFEELLPDISNLDPNNPAHLKELAHHLLKTMEQLGVSVSVAESVAIANEIRTNPSRILDDLRQLSQAFVKLKTAGQ